MAEKDKFNIDSIIARLLEGKWLLILSRDDLSLYLCQRPLIMAIVFHRQCLLYLSTRVIQNLILILIMNVCELFQCAAINPERMFSWRNSKLEAFASNLEKYSYLNQYSLNWKLPLKYAVSIIFIVFTLLCFWALLASYKTYQGQFGRLASSIDQRVLRMPRKLHYVYRGIESTIIPVFKTLYAGFLIMYQLPKCTICQLPTVEYLPHIFDRC